MVMDDLAGPIGRRVDDITVAGPHPVVVRGDDGVKRCEVLRQRAINPDVGTTDVWGVLRQKRVAAECYAIIALVDTQPGCVSWCVSGCQVRVTDGELGAVRNGFDSRGCRDELPAREVLVEFLAFGFRDAPLV